jgi:hypothetical protein
MDGFSRMDCVRAHVVGVGYGIVSESRIWIARQPTHDSDVGPACKQCIGGVYGPAGRDQRCADFQHTADGVLKRNSPWHEPWTNITLASRLWGHDRMRGYTLGLRHVNALPFSIRRTRQHAAQRDSGLACRHIHGHAVDGSRVDERIETGERSCVGVCERDSAWRELRSGQHDTERARVEHSVRANGVGGRHDAAVPHGAWGTRGLQAHGCDGWGRAE